MSAVATDPDGLVNRQAAKERNLQRVRQALAYALDVPALLRNLYAGMGKPYGGGLADTDFGYNPTLKP